MPILWMEQDVIAFPVPKAKADDLMLKALYERQLKVSSMIVAMAKQLYESRSAWIGGGTIPWDDLSVRRRAEYMQEVEALVKSVRGER